jgi:hypothetical protein
LNPRTPIVQPVAQRYADGAITALAFNADKSQMMWGIILRYYYIICMERTGKTVKLVNVNGGVSAKN